MILNSVTIKTRRSGVSRVESMALLAMGVFIIAVVMPALTKARGISSRSMCLQNLRQLGAAATAYAGDNIYLPSNVLWSQSNDGYLNYTILGDEANTGQWTLDPGVNEDHKAWIGSGDGDYEDMDDFINFGMLFGQRYLDSGQAFFCPEQAWDVRYNNETYFDGAELGSVEYRDERLRESRYYDSMSSTQLKRVRSSYISRNYCPDISLDDYYVMSGRVRKVDWPAWKAEAKQKMYYGSRYAYLADRWTYTSGPVHENKFYNVLYADGTVGTVSDPKGWVHTLGSQSESGSLSIAVGNSEGSFNRWWQAWWLLDDNFNWYNATAADWAKYKI